MGQCHYLELDMAVPALMGPFPLTPAGININQMPRSPAAFCLGTIGPDGRFAAGYVGRLDGALAARLQEYIGSPHYDVFMYALAASPERAFAIECEIYHGFKPRDNGAHPARPPDADWTCPVCGRF